MTWKTELLVWQVLTHDLITIMIYNNQNYFKLKF